MIVFAHTKFGLVRIQGSGVKRGAESAPPRSERVFQIPVQIGLRNSFFTTVWKLFSKLFIRSGKMHHVELNSGTPKSSK